MSDPSERTPAGPEAPAADLHIGDGPDDPSPHADDNEEAFDEDFDAMLSATDDVDPDIAP